MARHDYTVTRRAKDWFDNLSMSDKWFVGDQLVHGDFDWRDWFSDKPTPAFLNALDRARLEWEQLGCA